MLTPRTEQGSSWRSRSPGKRQQGPRRRHRRWCSNASARRVGDRAAAPARSSGLPIPPLFVQGSSDAGDELDALSLGIAEEPVRAVIAPVQPPASILPTAVRATEGEVVDLHHLSRACARPALLLPERGCVTRERRSSSGAAVSSGRLLHPKRRSRRRRRARRPRNCGIVVDGVGDLCNRRAAGCCLRDCWQSPNAGRGAGHCGERQSQSL
jgi:hypothetical protein